MHNFVKFDTLLEGPKGLIEQEQWIDINQVLAFREIVVPSKIAGGFTHAVILFLPGQSFVVSKTVEEIRLLLGA